MLKLLFSTRGHALPTTTTNEAGGRAYAFSPEHALAQYALTGTVHNTFYATAEDQLSTVLALAGAVSPEFVAKTALYCRTHGFMKDVPALLVAYLAKADVKLMSAVFPAVIDNGKMLRNFVQIVRSGAVGRKSLGTAPKRAARTWFASRAPDAIFRQSTGQSPSMADVLKLVRPSPALADGAKDTMREALYGYLIGKDVDNGALPPNVRAFETFKSAAQTGADASVPDVPFEMLTALPLTKEHWKQIARTMSWTQTRMNLNTLLRNGVFGDEEMVRLVEGRLKDAAAIRRAKAFPYQLLAAFRAAGEEMPRGIRVALEDALEIATENVPAVAGKLYICPDVSGSMQSPVTGHRKGATSAVRCVDVAGLLAASLLRRNPDAELLAFSDDVVKMPRPLNPRDTVMTNAQYLASLPTGLAGRGTACSAPLRHLNEKGARGDIVVYVSDNQSWADFARTPGAAGRTRGTAMAEEWERFRTRNPTAKLVLIDLQPNATTQVQTRADVLNIGGFSDSVFELVSLFANGEVGTGGEHLVEKIRSQSLIN